MLGNFILIVFTTIYLVIFCKKNMTINGVAIIQLLTLLSLFLFQYNYKSISYLSTIGILSLCAILCFIVYNYVFIKRNAFSKYNIIFGNYILLYFSVLLALETQPSILSNFELIFIGLILITVFYLIKYFNHVYHLKHTK